MQPSLIQPPPIRPTPILTACFPVQFQSYVKRFYPYFVDLVAYSAQEVRTSLSVIFTTKINRMLFGEQ